jgi:hypothetical protein
MESNLLGKFVEIGIKTRYQSNKQQQRICKIIDVAENNYTLVDVETFELYRVDFIASSATGYNEKFLLPAMTTDKGTCIKTRSGQVWWIQDFYLHRTDGPAIQGKGKNEFWLLGQKMSKEQFLDALPEDLQTEMLFHLDRL